MPNHNYVGEHKHVDLSELSIGTRVEMEHTDDPKIAQKIAMDHLVENPRYYSMLLKFRNPWTPVKQAGIGAVIGFILAKLTS